MYGDDYEGTGGKCADQPHTEYAVGFPKEIDRLNYLALEYLTYFGNSEPTDAQITCMEALLQHVNRGPISFLDAFQLLPRSRRSDERASPVLEESFASDSDPIKKQSRVKRLEIEKPESAKLHR